MKNDTERWHTMITATLKVQAYMHWQKRHLRGLLPYGHPALASIKDARQCFDIKALISFQLMMLCVFYVTCAIHIKSTPEPYLSYSTPKDAISFVNASTPLPFGTESNGGLSGFGMPISPLRSS